jgi:hypothetical protein
MTSHRNQSKNPTGSTLIMSPRAASWLAWSLWTLSLALTVVSLILLVLNRLQPNVYIFDYWVEYTVTAISGSTVGAVIISQRTHNLIGWIFCMGGGLSAGIENFAAQYATYALRVTPDPLPGGHAAAWVTSWMWTFSVGLFVFLCLLFPNGELPSRRWRWVAWLSGVVLLAGAVLIAFQPGPIDGLDPKIRNPIEFGSGAIVQGMKHDFLVQALLGGLGLVAVASLVVRFVHSGGEERLQIKVFTYAATVLACGVVLAYTIHEITGIPWISWIGRALVIVGLVGVPIAVGIAVRRYHLYHIDIIIKHTLVYVSLTAILAALFELYVVLLSGLFSEFAHIEPRRDESRWLAEVFSVKRWSDVLSAQWDNLKKPHRLAEVLAALAVAALFDPLRGRIQRFVERYLTSGEEESRTPPRSE